MHALLSAVLPLLLPAVLAVGCAALGAFLKSKTQGLPPDQRQAWLQQAASAALVLSNVSLDVLKQELPAATATTLSGQANSYLALHGIKGVKVTPQNVGLVLADLRLGSAGGDTVPATPPV